MNYPTYPIPLIAESPDDEDGEKTRAILRKRFMETEDPVMGTTQLLLALGQMRPRSTPKRATVSGGSVIGLAPEQTNSLLNRVAAENEYNARIAAEEDARRDRAIEGFGRTIFRARDMEAAQRERIAQREQEQRARQERDAAQHRYRMEEIDARSTPDRLTPIRTVDASGNPVTRYEVPKPGAEYPAYVRPDRQTEAGGTSGTPSQIAYTINGLRRQGLTIEQISKNFPALAPHLEGVTESGEDPARTLERERWIRNYISQYGEETYPQAERIWAISKGEPVPRLPIEEVAKNAPYPESRKKLGQYLVDSGYTPEEAVEYLNRIGLADNVRTFWWDNPTDPGQWGNQNIPAETTPSGNATIEPQVSTAPQIREKDGMQFVQNAEGKWVRVQ